MRFYPATVVGICREPVLKKPRMQHAADLNRMQAPAA
jgi:hypothetical protein